MNTAKLFLTGAWFLLLVTFVMVPFYHHMGLWWYLVLPPVLGSYVGYIIAEALDLNSK